MFKVRKLCVWLDPTLASTHKLIPWKSQISLKENDFLAPRCHAWCCTMSCIFSLLQVSFEDSPLKKISKDVDFRLWGKQCIVLPIMDFFPRFSPILCAAMSVNIYKQITHLMFGSALIQNRLIGFGYWNVEFDAEERLSGRVLKKVQVV